MFNRLLKSFALAAAFLGVIYFLTQDSQGHKPNFSFGKIQQDIKQNEAPAPVAETPLKEKEEEVVVKPQISSITSSHACVLEILPDIAEASLPSVVSIQNTQIKKQTARADQREKITVPGPFGDLFKEFFDNMPQTPRRVEAQGSGFIMRVYKDGKPYNAIITNYHVVRQDLAGASNALSVTFHNGNKMDMQIFAKDPKSDIAILMPKDIKNQKILNQLPSLTWGDSSKVRTGQKVLALGNPFGLGSTVTDGIISYTKGRDIPSMSENSKYINILPSLIQHSAQINMGSSGGVLLGLFKENNQWVGHAIGINTAIYTPSGGNVGVGFSIPSNMAKEKIDSMMQYGRVMYGWLGVMILPMQDMERKNFGIPQTHVFRVEDLVEKSPAAKAGLKKGDVIASFNGKVFDKDTRLEQLVSQTKPGTKVYIGVYRNNNFKDIEKIEVLIEENQMQFETTAPDATTVRIAELGMEVETYKNRDEQPAGARVISIEDTSSNISIMQGVEPGNIIDVIYVPLKNNKFEERKIGTAMDLDRVAKELKKAGIKNVNCQVKISETRGIIKPLAID
ncbi:MAG: trypsin-like peptidase domain-containing protein [Alphaproteobacteria bacterium]|nr:MAG: trypsin-like peptidase domain-containing protein [Alphaproteobacteria bacterium]